MFLMNTLTVPKIKDLVNKPNQQYQDIYSTMGGSAAGPSPPSAAAASRAAAAALVANNGIADELSSFLNDLKKTTPEKKNNDFETFSNSNDIGYSLF